MPANPQCTVLFLMGTPGSGKNTIAKELQNKFGAIVYDKDVFSNLETEKTGFGSIFTKTEVKKNSVYQTLIDMIKDNIQSNNFFIIMGNFVGNKLDSSVSAMSVLLEEFAGFQKVFLRLKCDPDTQYERVKQRYESGVQVNKDERIVKNKQNFLKFVNQRNLEEEQFLVALKQHDASINYIALDSRNAIDDIANEAHRMIAKIHYPCFKMDSPLRLSPPLTANSNNSTPLMKALSIDDDSSDEGATTAALSSISQEMVLSDFSSSNDPTKSLMLTLWSNKRAHYDNNIKMTSSSSNMQEESPDIRETNPGNLRHKTHMANY